MQKWLRYTVLFLIAITVGFCLSLKFESVQTWAKNRLERALLQETGYTVSVGAFRGAPPFLLGLDNVALSHPEIGKVQIASVDLIPSWPEILFGKLAFVWICADGIDLTKFKLESSEQKPIQMPSCAVHSLRLSNIAVDKPYYEMLLNEYSDQTDVTCLYNLSGNMSWSPQKEKLKGSLTLEPHAKELSPLRLSLDFDCNKETTTLIGSVDALKTADGSVFFSLPCDRLSFDTTLKADTKAVMSVLEGVKPSNSPFISGSWTLSGLQREKTKPGLNPIIRFMAEGTLEAHDCSNFSFATSELSCQKIEPIHSRKKKRVTEEMILASAEDTQDTSALSRIITISVPKSIQGSLKVEDKSVTCMVSASQVAFKDHTIPNCSVLVTTDGKSGTFQTDLALQYGNYDFPVRISSSFTSDHRLPDFTINLPQHTIEGDLRFSLYPFVLRGSLESKKNDNLYLHASFDPETENDKDDLTQKMDIIVKAHDTPFCKQLTLNVNSEGLFSHPTVRAVVDATGIEQKGLSIHQLHIDTNYTPDQELPYNLHIEGESDYGPCRVDSSGFYTTSSCTIQTFEALSGGHTIKNSAPVHISQDSDGLHIFPFEFTSDTNMLVQGDGLFSDKRLFANLTYANLPLECFDPILGDITLFGAISGHLALSGKQENPELVMTVASSALSLWNPKKLDAPPLAASCEIKLKEGVLNVSSEIEGLSLKKPTQFRLTAPLDFSPLRFSETKKLTAEIQSEFDLNSLLSSYLDEDEIMEGIVQIDAKVNGLAYNPTVTGSCSWNDGRLFVPCLGTLFNNVQMSGHLEDNALYIDKLRSDDGSSGSFEATGWIKNLISKKLNYRIDGKSKNFQTIILDDTTATASGTITIAGDATHGHFSGEFDLHDAAFILSSNLSKEIPKLDITYIGKKQKPQINQGFNATLDLALNLEQGFVRGMGLESTWKGNAQVTGKNKDIDVKGKIMLTSGTLDFASKSFALTQGSLEFGGDLYRKSNLHVLASNEVSQLTTQIVLQGPLESPHIF
ncbi:MAG: translocation/assembly module TamB domain-containing protein, partial [Verrucomicrobia bacterium]|nr:translocation/assembly module TamB domain-containing protein [Verrucomicrobiota bacterium]